MTLHRTVERYLENYARYDLFCMSGTIEELESIILQYFPLDFPLKFINFLDSRTITYFIYSVFTNNNVCR